MKNIETLKKIYLERFALKYYHKSKEDLTDSEELQCSSLAEFWGYVHAVVPENHAKYNIFDFSGMVILKDNIKDISVAPKIALFAKNQVCKYCWGIGWEYIKKEASKLNKEDVPSLLRKRSIMSHRYENGNHVVIFGSSEKPIGRTMLASIIMKEAIKLRVGNCDRGQTYNWVDFSQLLSYIKKDGSDIVNYRSCDWLVIDNIVRKSRSAAQLTLLTDFLDPFFIERFENKLPTILVFKFDIRDKSLSMEKVFGIGMNRLVDSDKTFMVPLSEEMKILDNE